MLRFLFWTFVFYLLFRLIFDFIVPVFRVSRKMKEHIRDFNANINQQGQQPPPEPPKEPAPAKKGGEYIDFEEVK